MGRPPFRISLVILFTICCLYGSAARARHAAVVNEKSVSPTQNPSPTPKPLNGSLPVVSPNGSRSLSFRIAQAPMMST